MASPLEIGTAVQLKQPSSFCSTFSTFPEKGKVKGVFHQTGKPLEYEVAMDNGATFWVPSYEVEICLK